MKIMFISDIHGSKSNLKRIREIYDLEKADIIIVLGDLFLGEKDRKEIEDIINSFPNKVVIKGNNDTVGDLFSINMSYVDEFCFTAFGKRFYCSHGNVYNINHLPNKDFDVLVYGHSHVGDLIKDASKYSCKYYINPGSISYPRAGTNNSYIVVDEKGIYLKNLSQDIVDFIKW
jgi:putative phosphoesterase